MTRSPIELSWTAKKCSSYLYSMHISCYVVSEQCCITHFYGVEFSASKSGSVNFLTNIMSAKYFCSHIKSVYMSKASFIVPFSVNYIGPRKESVEDYPLSTSSPVQPHWSTQHIISRNGHKKPVDSIFGSAQHEDFIRK